MNKLQGCKDGQTQDKIDLKLQFYLLITDYGTIKTYIYVSTLRLFKRTLISVVKLNQEVIPAPVLSDLFQQNSI